MKCTVPTYKTLLDYMQNGTTLYIKYTVPPYKSVHYHIHSRATAYIQ